MEGQWGRWSEEETYLIVVAVIADDVDGLDNIDVLQAGPDTELCAYFLFVFAFCFPGAARTELLDRIYGAPGLGTAAYEANSAPCAGAKDTTPFAVLFGEVGVCRRGEGGHGVGISSIRLWGGRW